MENNNKVQEFVDVLVEALDGKFDFASPEDKQFFYENIVEIILSSEEVAVEDNIDAFLNENYDNPEEMQTLLSEGIGSAVGKIFTGIGKGIGGVLSGLGSGVGAVLHGPAPVRYYDGYDRNKKKKPKDEKTITTPPTVPPKPPVPPKSSNTKSGEFVGYTPKPEDYEGDASTKKDEFKTDAVPYGEDGRPNLAGTGYTRTPEAKGGSLSPSQAERFRQERQRRKETRNADESVPSGTGQTDLAPIPDREKSQTTAGRPLGGLGRGKVSPQQSSDVTSARGQQPGRRTSSTGATVYTGPKNPDLSFDVAKKRTADAIRRRAAVANPREVYSGLQVGSKLRRESVEDSNSNSMITESLKFISKKAPYEKQ
jgi:hypothetical protein